ncbi:hypothetical protein NPIL_156081 [Nephila pilipes]|uniref:Uncharacterized protein n=1 Tax=Nephila pilipes TaxID=299642 RepID=A0A8X6PGJ1_NEPPI|nr:hypothetical protein NPIL_156081 [Nephila pilipes]
MHAKIIAKTFLLTWMWCLVRLLIFNTYEIVMLLPIIIILDKIITPSRKKTSVNNTRPQAIGMATQEDREEKKKKIIVNKGKEEIELDEMISKLMNYEKKKALYKGRKTF